MHLRIIEVLLLVAASYSQEYCDREEKVVNSYGKLNVSLRNGKNNFCWRLPLRTEPFYTKIKFDQSSITYSDAKCEIPIKDNDEFHPPHYCNKFKIKITTNSEKILFRGQGSVVGTWCDELPPDNLVIFARQIHIHFTFCNPYRSVSFLQNFAEYEINNSGQFSFVTSLYTLVRTYNMVTEEPGISNNMRCDLEFANNELMPLQIEEKHWSEYDQGMQIYDGNNTVFPIGTWTRGEPIQSYIAKSGKMRLIYLTNAFNNEFRPFYISFIVKVQGYCLPGFRSCGDFKSCYNESKQCDGSKDCDNGADETGCIADPHLGCYSDSFWCGHKGVEDKILNKQCIPLYKLCDGIVDCRNGNDELMCSSCNATTSFACDRTSYGHVRCYHLYNMCNHEIDCEDHFDEISCPPSRRVITASVIGGLICGVLFACALGCSMRLFGLRNAHLRRHSLALQQTPLGRMTRRLLQREAPPSYNMAVHGREHEPRRRGGSDRRRRRHRRRRNEIRIRRSQPSQADLQQISQSSRDNTVSTRSTSSRQHRDESRHRLLSNETPVAVEIPQTPPNLREQVENLREEIRMRGGRAPTPLPDIREEERSRQISPTTSPVATPTRNEVAPPQRSSIFSIFGFGGSPTGSNLFPLSRICSASGRANPVTRTTSSSTSSRSRRSRGNRRSSSQAPPIPKKRPIKPVKIAAPCDHNMVVDQSPACIYPNPPSYNDSHKDQTISLLSVETNETGQSVSSDRERHHSTDLISFRGAMQPCGSDVIGSFGSEGGESTSVSSSSTAGISPTCS